MDFKRLRQYRNTCNPFAQKLGTEVVEISTGYAKVNKEIGIEDINPWGRAHGGIYLALADIACGSAMASYGYMSVTTSSDYHFFRSARPGDVLTAIAQECKHGGRISVCTVEVRDQNNILLGNGTFTFYRTDTKITL